MFLPHKQKWITPHNSPPHLRCLTCCSSCSASPSPPLTTRSPLSGRSGRCGAPRWIGIYFVLGYFHSQVISRSSTWSSWRPSSPSTPSSWCLLTGDLNQKQLALTFYPLGVTYFIILVIHFRLHSRAVLKLLIYLDNFVKLLHIPQPTLIINNYKLIFK